jgi:hypothetical protein
MEITIILQATAALKAVVEKSAMIDPERIKEAAWSLAQMIGVYPGTILGTNTYSGERLGFFQIAKVKDIELTWNANDTSMRLLVDVITRCKHGQPLEYIENQYLELLTKQQIELLTDEDWSIALKNWRNERTPSEP